MSKFIDTDEFSRTLRDRAIDLEGKKILITNYAGSEQEMDLSEPTNCEGFGRIRHFKLKSSDSWPSNPLPTVPAAVSLELGPSTEISAQVFQNAVCNWRCWYCFVDFKLLAGDKRHSKFLTCGELLDLYLKQGSPPRVIDLTGGQPDLTPEWIPWMMDSIKERGLDKEVYLWSDDNLSNDYFWRYLTDSQIATIIDCKHYGRVCCFKGIDKDSFSLNTKANPELFERQFDLYNRIYHLGIDLYGYITLNAHCSSDFQYHVPKFFDRIQSINENLILRMVPLEVFKFRPVVSRLAETEEDLLKGQYIAIEFWREELQKRFTTQTLAKSINDVNIY